MSLPQLQGTPKLFEATDGWLVADLVPMGMARQLPKSDLRVYHVGRGLKSVVDEPLIRTDVFRMHPKSSNYTLAVQESQITLLQELRVGMVLQLSRLIYKDGATVPEDQCTPEIARQVVGDTVVPIAEQECPEGLRALRNARSGLPMAIAGVVSDGPVVLVRTQQIYDSGGRSPVTGVVDRRWQTMRIDTHSTCVEACGIWLNRDTIALAWREPKNLDVSRALVNCVVFRRQIGEQDHATWSPDDVQTVHVGPAKRLDLSSRGRLFTVSIVELTGNAPRLVRYEFDWSKKESSLEGTMALGISATPLMFCIDRSGERVVGLLYDKVNGNNLALFAQRLELDPMSEKQLAEMHDSERASVETHPDAAPEWQTDNHESDQGKSLQDQLQQNE